MFCVSCGAENANDARFCGSCGKSMPAQNVDAEVITSGRAMSFSKSISTCFAKYVVWQGRASRAEYWWFSLFTILLSWAAAIVDSVAMEEMPLSGLIVSLAIFLPSLSVTVRRLHDTNRSGWWFFIYFTIIGIPVMIYWLASKGDENQNDYGSSPLGR